MPARRTHLHPNSAHGQLSAALAALREREHVSSGFPPDVIAEAEAVRSETPALDLRDIPFITIDPPGSRDLDQALHLERTRTGFTVRYAIADVPAFVRAGGAIDHEARERGQTLYLPDGTVPLHPPVLSEDRASLVAGADRSACVWTVELDAAGAAGNARVERALIRSREQLDYPSVQRTIDSGKAAGSLELLPVIGALRLDQERLRGGASLNLPDEEVIREPDGYRIVARLPLPVEEWNAQLSLLVGIAAAEMMLAGGVGILRTMPPPTSEDLELFRRRVAALGTEWPASMDYGEYLRALPRDAPRAHAVMQAAAGLFRGAGYEAFDGALPETRVQAAIAAPYAHVTAPLRRLVDRWGLAICLALSAGEEIPAWARESLPEVPALMQASISRAGRLTAEALDRVEAALLRERIGDVFEAIVLEVRGDRARVQLKDPLVTAHCPADGLTAGTLARVRVDRADVDSGAIELSLAR